MRQSLTAGGPLAALLLLGACDGGRDAPAVAANEGAPANATTAGETAEDYRRRIEALGEGPRNATFIRAIRDAGRDCQHVERSAPRAPVNGAPAWTATCEGGTEWILILGGGGTVQVTHARELEAAGIEAGGNAQAADNAVR